MVKLISAIFLILSIANGQDSPNIYAGAQRCQVCHETPEMGNQHANWVDSKHAKAYETLLGEDALAIAKEQGMTVLPSESPDCLSCHVTGYNDPNAEFGEKFEKESGIQCESCHGAGELYRKEIVMCDKDQAIANGLIIPKPEDCLVCHNEKSPRYKPFDYDSFYKKIAHTKNPDFKCETDEDEDEEW
ncbi:MAG: cytochrome C554 [Candidatus Marinimicrobia bacterium]|nr:cytochrome C554 [Candidatus Neomarinimicrobiota bacterium]